MICDQPKQQCGPVLTDVRFRHAYGEYLRDSDCNSDRRWLGGRCQHLGDPLDTKVQPAVGTHVWQRDLRVQLYSECASPANALVDLMLQAISNEPPPPDQMKTEADIGPYREMERLVRQLSKHVADFRTFGSQPVSEAAKRLGLVANDALRRVEDGRTSYDTYQALDELWEEMGRFGDAIHESLRISDD